MNTGLAQTLHRYEVLMPARRRRWRWGPAISMALLLALSIVFLFPFVWLLCTAVKPLADLESFPVTIWPAQPQWSNFSDALTMFDFGHYARNSLELAVIMTVLTAFTSATVGFGFARLRAPGKQFYFMLMLATMMLPGLLMTIPTYVMFARLGLVGTYWPWVLWGLGASPFMAFLFRQFFASIPRDLEDAAIVDGCGYYRIFWSIFLPLSKPVIATVAILQFQWTWNDWFAPLIFLNGDNTTLSVMVAQGYVDPSSNVLTNIQAAGAIYYVLPVIVLFFLAQRYFIQGVVTTGLKG
jgi:ABC-type glycerol-3-phosphate transport system permease component